MTNSVAEPNYMHEDQLPDDMPRADYDKWYSQSWLSDGNIGVRVGPVYPFVAKRVPLCPIHQSLEDRGQLEVEIAANNCTACSLNERKALLDLLAPFAADHGSEDSLTVMRRLADFYATHAGDNRVVVSYPAGKGKS